MGREKRKLLLLILCQHEADRLEIWVVYYGPVSSAFSLTCRICKEILNVLPLVG